MLLVTLEERLPLRKDWTNVKRMEKLRYVLTHKLAPPPPPSQTKLAAHLAIGCPPQQ